MTKYVNCDVVFQEIPDEVTLAIFISNCPNRCEGCHTPQLTEDIGEELTMEVLTRLLRRYGSTVTCICFMGGDADHRNIERLASFIKNTTKLKTAWYSGRDMFPLSLWYFDYVKLGPYIEKLGGLTNPTTNQRLYRISEGGIPEDITYKFHK